MTQIKIFENFKLLNLLLLLIFTASSSAQDLSIAEFVPDNFTLFEQYRGDLNADAVNDHILIIKNTEKKGFVENHSGNTVDRNRRGIIILLSDGTKYEKVVENKDCFYSENEDGGVYMPPELSVKIEDQLLKIHFGHGRYGYWQYIFKYMHPNFNLIGYNESSNRGPKVLHKTSFDFLKQEKITSENISTDDYEEIFEVETSEIKVDNLIKLSEIKDFQELRRGF